MKDKIPISDSEAKDMIDRQISTFHHYQSISQSMIGILIASISVLVTISGLYIIDQFPDISYEYTTQMDLILYEFELPDISIIGVLASGYIVAFLIFFLIVLLAVESASLLYDNLFEGDFMNGRKYGNTIFVIEELENQLSYGDFHDAYAINHNGVVINKMNENLDRAHVRIIISAVLSPLSAYLYYIIYRGVYGIVSLYLLLIVGIVAYHRVSADPTWWYKKDSNSLVDRMVERWVTSENNSWGVTRWTVRALLFFAALAPLNLVLALINSLI